MPTTAPPPPHEPAPRRIAAPPTTIQRTAASGNADRAAPSMTSKPRKRARPVAENQAHCPFTVQFAPTASSDDIDAWEKKSKRDQIDAWEKKCKRNDIHTWEKKCKRDSLDDKRPLVKMHRSPFQPSSKFKTHQTLDLLYLIEPWRGWKIMTHVGSFRFGGIWYFPGDDVFIANDSTIERQRPRRKGAKGQDMLQSAAYWVARILDVKVRDENHVYALVCWMYSPDELPPCTMDGKKFVSGRQPYHGQNELIASNHMDVINVISIAKHAVVHHWIESDDDQVHETLYWRQAFDCRTSELSSVRLTCKCRKPANPDKMLVGCTNPDCEEWLHHDCLLHDVLMRVYERLGTDQVHTAAQPQVKVESDNDRASEDAHPDSHLGIEGEVNEATGAVGAAEKGHGVDVLQVDRITPQTPPPGPSSSSSSRIRGTAEAPSRCHAAKTVRPKKSATSKPYEGLFDASLKLDDGPTAWVMTDLRTNVQGGEKTWIESVFCLLCGVAID